MASQTSIIKRKLPEDTSPPKRDSKKTKQAPQVEKCVTCKKEAKKDAVQCQWCCKWEHRICAGLTQNEYNILSGSSEKIMFFCTLCYTKVAFALKVDSGTSALQQEQQNVNARLEAVEEKLTGIVEGINEQLENYNKPLSKITPDPSDEESVAHLTSSIIFEQKEKEKRQLNLILHNIEESKEEDPQTRKRDDIKTATSLFTESLGVETLVTNAIRIGKKGGRARLLKVTVSNLQDKVAILRNKSKLKNGNNLNQEKPVYVSADCTPLEQKKNKMLRNQLNEMNKDGKNYIIKNGTIVPRRP